VAEREQVPQELTLEVVGVGHAFVPSRRGASACPGRDSNPHALSSSGF
jgi:hypothetical protein